MSTHQPQVRALALPQARAPGGWALCDAATPGAGRRRGLGDDWPLVRMPNPAPEEEGPEDPGVRPKLPREGGEPTPSAFRSTPTPKDPGPPYSVFNVLTVR